MNGSNIETCAQDRHKTGTEFEMLVMVLQPGDATQSGKGG